MDLLGFVLAGIRLRSLGHHNALYIGIFAIGFIFAVIGMVIAVREMPPDNPLEGFDVDDPSDVGPDRESGA